jgi:carboxymethylenebutenolidase
MRTDTIDLGFVARPESDARAGVVVIHDVWGLYEHYRDLARRLADAGFAALAIDLYRRTPEPKITDPGRWIRGLDDRVVLADVQAAVDRLRADGASHVGVIGCCMGGQYTLLAAAGCDRVDAAVAWYGMLSDAHGLLAPAPGETLDRARKPRAPLDVAAELRCPTLAFFGEDDAFIPPDDVRAFEAKLAPVHRAVVYPGAGHAFLNDTRAELYRPDAARDSWARMLDWMRTHLAA